MDDQEVSDMLETVACSQHVLSARDIVSFVRYLADTITEKEPGQQKKAVMVDDSSDGRRTYQ